jgi:hypothetical protein
MSNKDVPVSCFVVTTGDSSYLPQPVVELSGLLFI